MSRASACLLLVLTSVFSAAAQDAPPGQPLSLTLSPAGAPRPSLKYRLLPAPGELVAGNAATQYYRAFALFVENQDLLRDIHQDQWDRWLDMPLEKLPLQEVEGRLRGARHLLHEIELGTRYRQCDWQLEGRPEGFGLLLPDVQGYRRVGVLLAVRARCEMARKQWPQAVHTLQTGFALARHITQGPFFVQVLVGLAIARQMSQEVEEFIQQPGAPNLYWALTLLPRPFADLGPAIEDERTMLERFFPLLKQAGEGPLTLAQVQAGLVRLRHHLDDLGVRRPSGAETVAQAALITWSYPDARHSLLTQGWKAEDLDAMPTVQVVTLHAYREYRDAYDEAVKWVHVPDGFRHPGYQEARRRYRQAMRQLDRLFFRGLLRGLGNEDLDLEAVSVAVTRLDRKSAALRCLEALRLHAAAHGGKWPATLQALQEVPAPTDPLTGKPFEYKLGAVGATLSAPLPPVAPTTPTEALHYELTWRR
jgi:hypothetical protein